MADDEVLLNDLFAYRLLYMDISIDENYIIQKLKQKLIELNYSVEDLNNILYSFYNYFDIPITLSEIENVHSQNISNIIFIDINTIFNNQDNNDNQDNDNQDIDSLPPLINDNNDINDIDDVDDMPPLEETFHYDNVFNQTMPNLLNILLGYTTNPFGQVLVQPNNDIFNDVVITTDEQSLNNLPILKLNNMNIKCMICIEEMNEDDEYFDIECKHIFHRGCLETYLRNYNHICPICRKDIGNSQPIL